jgi:cytochrome c biogenesis protein CcmG/thiol:disulfide interchange protein DsbE
MTLPVRGVAVAAALAVAVAGCAPKRSPRRVSSLVGQRLELAAPDLAGRDVDVGAEQGRVRIVDFWASWCEPCREALPHLDALAAELGPGGVAAYAVSFDDDRAQIAAFLREVPVRFPVLWDRGGQRLSARFEVNRLPTTLVVDRKGVVRLVQDGWSEAKAVEARREVQRLLAEP